MLAIADSAGSADASDRSLKPFIASRNSESQAVAADGYVAWVRSTRRRKMQLYLRKPSGKVVHVNRPGTRALLGAISNGKLVYQEIARRRSKIRFMDLKTHRRWTVPKAVDRRGTFEYMPVMSDGLLVFLRWNPRVRGDSIHSYNLRTRRTRTIDNWHGSTEPPYLQLGQLNGRHLVYVLWHRGQTSLLRAIDLKTGMADWLLSPSLRGYLWAPSVARDGTVYSIQTGSACGVRPRLVRFLLDDYYDEGRVLARLPEGWDSSHSHVVGDGSEKRRVIFQKSRCSTGHRVSDIYSFTDDETLTVTKAGLGMGTVTSSPGAIACGDICSDTFTGGRWVTLTAEPNVGSKFAGWSEPCIIQTDVTCRLRMTESWNVTATFEPGL